MSRVNFFNENVKKYDAWFDRNGSAHASELEALRDLLPVKGKGLEIGVGTGRFAAPLGVYLGIDPSIEMLKVAVERGIAVAMGVGENLPYKDASVDFALLVTTICFLDNVPGTLKEIYRVLRDGGYILIGFIDRKSFLGTTYETRKNDSVFYRDATFLSADEIIAHLRQTGFRDFIFRQTIFKNSAEIKETELVKPSFGEGSFVVVRGKKPFEQKGS